LASAANREDAVAPHPTLDSEGTTRFDSQEDFRRQFPGEDDHIEFKQGIAASRIAEAVVAFSNACGGVILLGVDDSGRAVGIDTGGETQAKIHRIVADVRNPGRYALSVLSVEARGVLALSVQRRAEGFAQHADGRVLVRRGAMNAALYADSLTRLVMERSAARYEVTPLLDAPLAKADPALLEALRQAFGWERGRVAARLVEIGFVRLGDPDVLTVAGVLFLTRSPADFLGKAYIEVFRYRDDSETAYDRREELSGPVNSQITAATGMLMAELGSDVVVSGVRRQELPRIPERVLREALANAVAHRSYEAHRQAIRLEVRPGRVVVRSPGGLPEPVTVANMRHQNAARNVAVIRALRRLGLAEDAGLGIDLMEDAMDEALLDRPRFDADADHVEVTLPVGSNVTPRERAWVGELERVGSILPRDRRVLVQAARGEVLTNASVREILGGDSTHARAALQRLRDAGFLEQHGVRGGASYTLAASVRAPGARALSPGEIADLVVALARRQGQVTNRDVRAQTGLDRAKATTLLRNLAAHGQLERRGERRGTVYLPPGP
jgi:ATP-dependent DNA helicase RecG